MRNRYQEMPTTPMPKCPMLDLERVLVLLDRIRSYLLLGEKQDCLHSCPHSPGGLVGIEEWEW